MPVPASGVLSAWNGVALPSCEKSGQACMLKFGLLGVSGLSVAVMPLPHWRVSKLSSLPGRLLHPCGAT